MGERGAQSYKQQTEKYNILPTCSLLTFPLDLVDKVNHQTSEIVELRKAVEELKCVMHSAFSTGQLQARPSAPRPRPVVEAEREEADEDEDKLPCPRDASKRMEIGRLCVRALLRFEFKPLDDYREWLISRLKQIVRKEKKKRKN